MSRKKKTQLREVMAETGKRARGAANVIAVAGTISKEDGEYVARHRNKVAYFDTRQEAVEVSSCRDVAGGEVVSGQFEGKRIWRYPMHHGSFSHDIPSGALFMKVGYQANTPCFWALVDAGRYSVKNDFVCVFTGEEIPADGIYVGTALVPSGVATVCVYHLFALLIGKGNKTMKKEPWQPPTCPCATCTKPTTMTGTKRCDACWEVEHRLRDYIKSSPAARKFVADALAEAMSR